MIFVLVLLFCNKCFADVGVLVMFVDITVCRECQLMWIMVLVLISFGRVQALIGCKERWKLLQWMRPVSVGRLAFLFFIFWVAGKLKYLLCLFTFLLWKQSCPWSCSSFLNSLIYFDRHVLLNLLLIFTHLTYLENSLALFRFMVITIPCRHVGWSSFLYFKSLLVQ